MQVHEVMSRNVLVVSPDDTIEKVATLMAQVDCGALPVGENDRLVPVENAKRIAARIPGAKLVVIPHASHIFNTDQPEAAHSAIMEFLDAQATRKREQPAAIPEAR